MTVLPEEIRNARRKAMQLLEHMDRTEKALSDRLRQAGFSERAAADAMAYVKSYGYIDDSRYARTYIACRMETKSRQKLIQELQQKGVDRQTAAEAWEEEAALKQPDERVILRRYIEKKYEANTELNEKEMRRLQGYLVRRGFQFHDISSVLEEMNIRISHETRFCED